ncbi:DUF4180 domain-containing protein [Arenibacter sp. M-2]|uniref:DUF4180 domain-containing protein n=1 Tax=Arenibacter sp. M-2 TaxID=3053612 RepID=UPI002570C4D2|nr:DUF4180 domain-containing protein [Arenibacter sp. M-2]MDL5514896.1 DUF4180 domain-containing protein [Arenibacter sp. M-2]
MEIKEHSKSVIKIAEIISNEIIIKTTEDALDLMGNIYYQGYDKMILHQKNITPEFFDLKTKLAGDILQKFAQYQMSLIIVGDFSNYSSKSLQNFIYESNNGSQVNFLSSMDEALNTL